MEADHRINEIGGLIALAEKLLKDAQASTAAQSESTEAFNQLVEQADVVLAGQIKMLKMQIDGLGKHAEYAGALAVTQAIGKELNGLSTTIEKITSEALVPALASLKAETIDALNAKTSLAQEAKRFSMRALGLFGGGVLVALALIAMAVWGSLAWQRSEVGSLMEEKAVLETNLAKLKELGGKIEISDCPDSKIGKLRKCVAVQPTLGISGYWGNTEKPFYVLKGY